MGTLDDYSNFSPGSDSDSSKEDPHNSKNHYPNAHENNNKNDDICHLEVLIPESPAATRENDGNDGLGITIPIQKPSSLVQAEGLKCCCGRKDCTVLEYNNVALEGLERDLDTAARLGQVCNMFDFLFCIFMILWLIYPLYIGATSTT